MVKTKIIEDIYEGFCAKDVLEYIYSQTGVKEIRQIQNDDDDSHITDWNEGKCEVRFNQKLNLPQNLQFIIGGRGSLPIVEYMLYFWDEDGSLKIESQIVMQFPGGSAFNTKVERILTDLENNGRKKCKIILNINCSVMGFWGFQATIESLMVNQGEEQCLTFLKISKEYIVDKHKSIQKQKSIRQLSSPLKQTSPTTVQRDRQVSRTEPFDIRDKQGSVGWSQENKENIAQNVQMTPPEQKVLKSKSNASMVGSEKFQEEFQEAEDHGETQSIYDSVAEFRRSSHAPDFESLSQVLQYNKSKEESQNRLLLLDINSNLQKIQDNQLQTNRILQQIYASNKLGDSNQARDSSTGSFQSYLPSWRQIGFGVAIGCITSVSIIAFQMHQKQQLLGQQHST